MGVGGADQEIIPGNPQGALGSPADFPADLFRNFQKVQVHNRSPQRTLLKYRGMGRQLIMHPLGALYPRQITGHGAA